MLDIHVGPEAPAGKDSNWILTRANDRFFLCFRCPSPVTSSSSDAALGRYVQQSGAGADPGGFMKRMSYALLVVALVGTLLIILTYEA